MVSFFNASFNSSIKAMEIALIDWIRKSKTNATILEYVQVDGIWRGLEVLTWCKLSHICQAFIYSGS